MGYVAKNDILDLFIAQLTKQYLIFAPKRFKNGGIYSDTDCIRYGEVTSIDQIVFDEKSEYSFKETVLPVIQTLFFFTEGSTKEADITQKEIIVFLRSCDLHGMKRLDDMYLHNGPADYYYQQIRSKVKFVLIGCEHSFENCFCVSMGTNRCENYEMSIDKSGENYRINCKNKDWKKQLSDLNLAEEPVAPSYVTENLIQVSIPGNLEFTVAQSKIWDEYDSRCINCGRCNFVCPTCTCFSMQDMYYSDNGKVGERRRVWASCMVDGFTDVAGGGSYRKKNGQRMRFKVLHKVYDYKKRNGYHMCVGCGRCDDICPEYISFSNCINKLSEGMKEVSK
ncbi:anaerobic sulfite reductase subunit AsrA [Aminipila terrae]|uniref:Anaerobic sulfite reductase subunit A n=1 Tax=Aminipila terrae TaxID=2697030 RepID=A0A6P1MN38_9FIRM|nr:anaerobic sulfite reductase subunit AsrA [Aminipila terrae]QHI73508.1 anaerobic sulfite reductase subunit A [Aminipila terrae]